MPFLPPNQRQSTEGNITIAFSALILLVGRQERHPDNHASTLPVKFFTGRMPLPLTVSCFSKIQIGFTFLVPAHPGRHGKRAIKRVCGCLMIVIIIVTLLSAAGNGEPPPASGAEWAEMSAKSAGRWSCPRLYWTILPSVPRVPRHAARCRVISNKCIAVRKVATPRRELTCHMGSHSVTCHPTELTFPPLPQPKLVLD